MLRWRLAGVVATLALLFGGGAAMRVGASVVESGSPTRVPQVLELYYTAPVLVRAGERVTIPVDVVCATAEGEACASSARISVTSAGQTASRSADATKGLEFDATGPTRRASGSAPSGRVDFALTATSGGRTVRLPSQAGSSLSFYVTRSMPVVHVPPVPFGQVRKPKTVLFLPWGSGPMRAGLSPGLESATLGPSSFDVDPHGRIHLVDPLQDRVAVYQHGHLVRQTHMPIGASGMVSVAPDGSSSLLDLTRGRLAVRSMSANGELSAVTHLGQGIVSQVRVGRASAYVNVLPLDAWLEVPGTGAAPVLHAGMPLGGGRELIRVAREDALRLGIVQGDEVLDAIELRSDVRFGEVSLAEIDRPGDYVVVARTWRAGSHPTDQFQVILIRPDRTVRTFAADSESFADAAPLGVFRLGPDGDLYQLKSSPDGIRILRFDLEEAIR